MLGPEAAILASVVVVLAFGVPYLMAEKPWRAAAVKRAADEYPVGTRVEDAVVVDHRWALDRSCAVCVLRRYSSEYIVNHSAMSRHEFLLESQKGGAA